MTPFRLLALILCACALSWMSQGQVVPTVSLLAGAALLFALDRPRRR